ncbi:MAG: hypothetical protein KC643_15940 [Nitrospira sp.]|nr:hypothetical protein [Nitrospira sp.]
MTVSKPSSPIKKLRTQSILQSAWKHIYDNGQHSKSADTKQAINEFKRKESANIDRIYRALLKGQYHFQPATGVLLGKKKRPVVISTVSDRVVQRAQLQVLQDIPSLHPYFRSPSSFGALVNCGVPKAISSYLQVIRNGATHFYKSDIKSFFTQIPRQKVLEIIAPIINDADFLTLLDKSTNTEIGNLSLLGDYKQYFEFNEIGTPQGCCLSPLLGNILLHQFDQEMNKGDIVCLRYLDDFLILGPSGRAVHAAFRRATKLLSSFGLSAYESNVNPDKAKSGQITQPFEYLGLDICGEKIRPASKARNNILTSVKQILRESLTTNFAEVFDNSKEDHSLVKTLRRVSKKLQGWGNQYYFCNDDKLWNSMDKQISELIKKHLSEYKNRKRKLKKDLPDPWKAERRQLGIHLLLDSKKRPSEFNMTE